MPCRLLQFSSNVEEASQHERGSIKSETCASNVPCVCRALLACPSWPEAADQAPEHRTVTLPTTNQETIGSKQPGTLAPTVLFPPNITPSARKPVTAHMREARDSEKATPTGLRAVSARPRRPCPGTSRPANLLVTNHMP